MPIFEFVCVDCATRVEELVSSRDCEEIACPKCGAAARKTVSIPGPLKKGAFPFKPGAPLKRGLSQAIPSPCAMCGGK